MYLHKKKAGHKIIGECNFITESRIHCTCKMKKNGTINLDMIVMVNYKKTRLICFLKKKIMIKER